MSATNYPPGLGPTPPPPCGHDEAAIVLRAKQEALDDVIAMIEALRAAQRRGRGEEPGEEFAFAFGLADTAIVACLTIAQGVRASLPERPDLDKL